MNRSIRAVSLSIALLIPFALAGCAGKAYGDAGGEVAATVVLANFKFNPQTVHIKAGQTVEWRNESTLVPHTVTGDPAQNEQLSSLPAGAEAFDQRLAPGDSYRHTFTVKGTYNYYCKPHAEEHGMTGSVIVE